MMKFASALVERELSRARWHYRRATSRYRCFPDVIIIGAQKSGTSSLFSYMSQHIQLIPSITKEVHYFDGGLHPEVDNFSKGPGWYQAFFPLRRSMNDKERAFEASPSYLFNPLVPERIASLLPNAKLIVVLRNPTERAISHYFHSRRLGHETLPIMDAFEAEDARLRYALATKNYKDDALIRMSYKSRGLYYEQLKRYIKYFKMNQILVLNSESLFQSPEEVLRRIYRFIGVNEDLKINNLKPHNVGNNRAAVSVAVHDYLDDFFQTHNLKLYDLIGQKFEWSAK